jgi:hypothetical protein
MVLTYPHRNRRHARRDRDLTVAPGCHADRPRVREGDRGQARRVQREGSDRSLNERLAVEVERAAHAQEESHALIARQRALSASIASTLADIGRRRRRTETDTGVPGAAHGRGRRNQR